MGLQDLLIINFKIKYQQICKILILKTGNNWLNKEIEERTKKMISYDVYKFG